MDDLEKVFLGKITAGMTHEINNVLATIREATGLMKDLVGATPDLPPQLADRLTSVTGRVINQVDRGSNLTSRLNRYAHTLDQPQREEDLDDLLQLAVDLNQRFARLKKLQLTAIPQPVPRRVPVPTFHLLLALSSSLTWLMDHSAPDSDITIGAPPSDSGLIIEITTQVSESVEEAAAGFDQWKASLEKLSAITGINLNLESAPDHLLVRLERP